MLVSILTGKWFLRLTIGETITNRSCIFRYPIWFVTSAFTRAKSLSNANSVVRSSQVVPTWSSTRRFTRTRLAGTVLPASSKGKLSYTLLCNSVASIPQILSNMCMALFIGATRNICTKAASRSITLFVIENSMRRPFKIKTVSQLFEICS